MKKFFLSIISLTIFLVLVWVAYFYYQFSSRPLLLVPNQKPLTVIIQSGESVHEIAAKLAAQNLLFSPHFFVLYARFSGISHKLQIGEYLITPGLTAKELLQHMLDGRQYQRRFTIVEGWTFTQIRSFLAANKHLVHLLDNLNAPEILQQIDAKQSSPEGLYFPATYPYIFGMSDLDILRQAYIKMSTQLNQAWKERAPNLPYQSPYEALIVASLIERETALENERPMIASVILNRLKKGMRLQIDPTVYYAVDKEYGDPLTRADLKSTSPFNTYRYKGLPPTPICMPGLTSIVAALHPAQSDNLFYVANGKGGHNFSTNYQDHQQAVKQYNSRE